MEQSGWNLKLKKNTSRNSGSIFPPFIFWMFLNIFTDTTWIKSEFFFAWINYRRMSQEPRTYSLLLFLFLIHGVASHGVPDSRQGKSRGRNHLSWIPHILGNGVGLDQFRYMMPQSVLRCVRACVCVYPRKCRIFRIILKGFFKPRFFHTGTYAHKYN